MLRIIRDVSKNLEAVSNRRLLSPEQLERENKSLRKWMPMDSINHIVREFSMDTKPKVKESRLSRRIQNALRRDEIELYEETESVPVQESPSYDMGGVSETTVFEEPRDL
jgi:DNA-directed RNA polymerase delta subunit